MFVYPIGTLTELVQGLCRLLPGNASDSLTAEERACVESLRQAAHQILQAHQPLCEELQQIQQLHCKNEKLEFRVQQHEKLLDFRDRTIDRMSHEQCTYQQAYSRQMVNDYADLYPN